MTQLQYSEIERQLIQILPELQPAAALYWKAEGEQGADAGPYVFLDEILGTNIEALLWLPRSRRRDELLRGAFGAVEAMLASSDEKVRELAAIEILAGREPDWLKRARDFVGPLASDWLKCHHPLWRICASANDEIVPQIPGGYHVRTVIARELAVDGVSENDVPGTTFAKGTLR